MSDMLEEIERAIELAEQGRGTSSKLQKASPIQIHIYNVFTTAKRELGNLKATVEDAQGVYMKGKK